MARWNDQDSSNSMFVLGALAGALVGAGVALLMAPRLGHDDPTSTLTGDRHNGGNTASMGDSFTATPGSSGYQS